MRVASGDVAPAAETLVELLRRQADRYGDKVAFAYSDNGDDAGRTQLTYAELDRKARAIAVSLQTHGAAGQRVLVLVRPGLEHIAGIFGCWYAGAIAVPAHETLAPRLTWVIPDAQPSFALVDSSASINLKNVVDSIVLLAGDQPLTWVLTDRGDADGWVPPEVPPNATALLLYTSGSTAAPKAVVLTHHNVLCNLESIRRMTGDGDQTVGLSWMPHQQNMGLISQVIMVIYLGGTGIGMSFTSFQERPLRWLEAIARCRATVTSAPYGAYLRCVEHSTPAERAALDLSCLSGADGGAEPVDVVDLRRFVEAFAPAGLRREAFSTTYGLSEATSTISGRSASPIALVVHLDRAALAQDRVVEVAPGDPTAVEVLGSGPPVAGQLIVIVDPQTRRECGPGEVGEIWIAGPHVAQGYWRRPEQTEQAFRAFLADTGEGPFLRAGDLGFFHSGELFITGRCRDLVTIRGENHYLNSIEATVRACHPMLLGCRGVAVVTGFESEGVTSIEQLVVVHEVSPPRVSEIELRDIVDRVQAALGEQHGIGADSVILLTAGQLPTTAVGKIQRDQCRQQFIEHRLDVLAEWHTAVPSPVQVQDEREAVLLDDIRAAKARQQRETNRG
ncbi:MAG TPA: fatty acyl-AMP ligase [Mycobacterium sp.]|nr:fatty acyl-AMP ligase [Mycobacterium sp.]